MIAPISNIYATEIEAVEKQVLANTIHNLLNKFYAKVGRRGVVDVHSINKLFLSERLVVLDYLKSEDDE